MKKQFTLIEIVVALGILAISLGGLLQLAISSQLKISRAREKWEEMHMLTQAAEYLLLHNEETTEIPPEFFPYPGYEINCTYDDAEGLPEEFENLTGQIPLKQCRIELIRSSDHKTVESVIIDRFGYEEESSSGT